MAYGFDCPSCGSRGPHTNLGGDIFECGDCHDEFTHVADHDFTQWPHATNKEMPHGDDKETPHA